MQYHPEHHRAPQHLSVEQAREALDELDNKLEVLRRRVRATAADSAHTYHQHIAALERKRELLRASFEQVRQAAGDDNKAGGDSLWTDLKSGIDTLRQDLKDLLD